jgi:hypothetical protein
MINYFDIDLAQAKELCVKYEKNVVFIVFEGETYNIKQIISLYNALNSQATLLKGFDITIKMNLSRRKALIVLLQEYFYNQRQYPFNVDIKEFEVKARNRFLISNRIVGEFITAQKIHPKNPREYYEDENHKMRQYVVAIEPLALAPDVFFQRKEAVESFLKIYDDIK